MPKPPKSTAEAAGAPGKPVKPEKPEKPEKPVRDSFTMPATDFALVAVLKARALEARRPAKKSELLRAGLHALHGLSPAALAKALDALAPVKAGRPKKK